MQVFTFDVRTYVTVPVSAKSEDEARALLTEAFVGYEANLGAWPSGDPILGNGGGFCDRPQLVDVGEPEYHLYGDYAMKTEKLISSVRGREAAEREWALALGRQEHGEDRLEMITFSASGEAETIWEWRRDEV